MDVFQIINSIMVEVIQWIDYVLLPATIETCKLLSITLPENLPEGCFYGIGVDEFVKINTSK